MRGLNRQRNDFRNPGISWRTPRCRGRCMLPLLAMAVLFQAQEMKNRTTPSPAPTTARAAATAAWRAAVVDGKDDDEVWKHATPIPDFLEFDPHVGGPPRFKTEAKVAYDARNFYAFVRAYDPEPQKKIQTLARRRARTATR